jgi:hypothetical protein
VPPTSDFLFLIPDSAYLAFYAILSLLHYSKKFTLQGTVPEGTFMDFTTVHHLLELKFLLLFIAFMKTCF